MQITVNIPEMVDRVVHELRHEGPRLLITSAFFEQLSPRRRIVESFSQLANNYVQRFFPNPTGLVRPGPRSEC